MSDDGLIVDLCAGAGGWSEALRRLGMSEVGYEKDKTACATARAAGHVRVQADIATVDLTGFGPLTGLIASTPCTPFSKAGKRQGILDQPRVFRFLDAIISFAKNDPATAFEKAQLQDQEDPTPWHDDVSKLVVEPARWILALRPRWVAFEQVPDVLPLWDRYVVLLKLLGYSAGAWLLSAEQYGVAQTRLRAILAASLDRTVSKPPATHHAYDPRAIEQDPLFEVDLMDWVSMAEALGWTGNPTVNLQRGKGMLERHGDRPGRTADQPAPTIRAGVGGGCGTNLVVTGERWPVELRSSAQPITGQARGPAAERGARPVTDPSYTIRAGGSGSNPSGTRWVYRNGTRVNAAERPADEPAPTVMFSSRGNDVRWVMQSNQTSDTLAKEKATRSVDAPSLTLTTNTRLFNWVHKRPAMTVQADPRIAEPGHRDREGGVSQFAGESVRVSVVEAAVLQSVRPDYPWQGSQTKQFEQVGNLIPPLLAVAVIGHLTGVQGWQDICRSWFRQNESRSA